MGCTGPAASDPILSFPEFPRHLVAAVAAGQQFAMDFTQQAIRQRKPIRYAV